jgi:D-glycero-D-manno-heptose 1,7-bisphosphate phosphatase
MGYLTKDLAKQMLDDLARVMVPRMPYLITMCVHAKDANCKCRKPEPGMINAIMGYHKMPKSRSIFIGDMDTDEMAAKNAGVEFAWIWDFCNVTRETWRENVGYL